jgi:hypothetical protein
MIGSSQDSKEALFTPVFIPRVSNKPILHTILFSPTNNFNCMSPMGWTGYILVNSRFVG